MTLRISIRVCAPALATCLSATNVRAEKAPNVLYLFKGAPDGSKPFGQLAMDSAGNLYSITNAGGTGADCAFGVGCGTIFRVTPEGKERVLYSFKGGCDGAFPWAGLVTDSTGNYYGTTTEGGTCDSAGGGTVFKLAADGTESVLYAFQGGSDGASPMSDLLLDDQGNIYGTTYYGGDPDCKKTSAAAWCISSRLRARKRCFSPSTRIVVVAIPPPVSFSASMAISTAPRSTAAKTKTASCSR